MKLFDIHNTITYDGRDITNILKRVMVPNIIKEQGTAFYNYIIQDGDTPEALAYKLYDDVNKHWIILALNDIIDPHFDWLLSENEVWSLTESKYGLGNEDSIHHYIDDTEEPVWDDRSNDPSGNALTSITNIVHEIIENEKKREIKILHQRYVKQFEKEYKAVISE